MIFINNCVSILISTLTKMSLLHWFRTALRMIGLTTASIVMLTLIIGTAFTAYARIAFMEVAGVYNTWTDLLLPHAMYCIGTGIFVPVLGNLLSQWVAQRLFSSLEEAKTLYAGVFTNGAVGSMQHDYDRLCTNRAAIERILNAFLSIITVLINVTVTVSHKSNVGMLIVPLINFGILFFFRTPSKKKEEEKKDEKKKENNHCKYKQFCDACGKASGGTYVCSSCASNQSTISQIGTTVKIGIITLLSECMCLMIFASSSGNGAMIISYISIAWMMRLTMNSCNSLGEKGEDEIFNSLLYLWIQLKRNQLSYNKEGLSIEAIGGIELKDL